jgi:hypothetical protein
VEVGLGQGNGDGDAMKGWEGMALVLHQHGFIGTTRPDRPILADNEVSHALWSGKSRGGTQLARQDIVLELCYLHVVFTLL